MKNTVIIFGYNNTRIYDIERIKNYCKEKLDADIVLCRETISELDKKITPHTIQVNLDDRHIDSIKQQIGIIDNYTEKNELNIIGCLPFADKGIPLGSYYAKNKGLIHDNAEKSVACIDKYQFRLLEKAEVTPEWYRKPFFIKIYSYEEAVEIVSDTKCSLFFKPTQEGNSRGCMEINSLADLEVNKVILAAYFKQGIIIEECIKGCDEYSFDGVNGSYIITEKKTSSGLYRVETQHILPAPLTDLNYSRLIEAGKIVAKISGSNGGAVHNELFLNKSTGEVYCVEPNRRPAGLKLWDWVAESYPGVDNWDNWISWACGRPVDIQHPENKSYYVGCRMLEAISAGKICSLQANVREAFSSIPDVIDIAIVKKIGDTVKSALSDNSDFIGYVVCRAKSIEKLRDLLDLAANKAATLYAIE